MSDNKLTTIQALIISTINQIEDLLGKLKERVNNITEVENQGITVEDVKPEDVPVDMTLEINSVEDILSEMDNDDEYDFDEEAYEEYMKTSKQYSDYGGHVDDNDKVESESEMIVIKNGSGIRYKIKEFADGTIQKLKEKFKV